MVGFLFMDSERRGLGGCVTLQVVMTSHIVTIHNRFFNLTCVISFFRHIANDWRTTPYPDSLMPNKTQELSRLVVD